MGLLGKIIGSFVNDNDEVDIFSESATCPYCGETMHRDGERFECPNCGVLFLENGEFVSPWSRSSHSGKVCESCGRSLTGGEFVSPWEEGNAHAFSRCPHCGHENEQDGYGEDD